MRDRKEDETNGGVNLLFPHRVVITEPEAMYRINFELQVKYSKKLRSLQPTKVYSLARGI